MKWKYKLINKFVIIKNVKNYKNVLRMNYLFYVNYLINTKN